MDVVEYVTRFYTLALKEHITDPLVHSEWTYFLSMLKAPVFEKERMELYLGILANERKRKGNTFITEINDPKSQSTNKYFESFHCQDNPSQKCSGYSESEAQRIKNIDCDQIFEHLELKMDRRCSEPYRAEGTDKHDSNKKIGNQKFDDFTPFNLNIEDNASLKIRPLESFNYSNISGHPSYAAQLKREREEAKSQQDRAERQERQQRQEKQQRQQRQGERQQKGERMSRQQRQLKHKKIVDASERLLHLFESTHTKYRN